MFNARKTTAGNGATFEPDPAAPLIATLTGTPADRHRGTPDVLERLIGRERQPDGSARLVVLPYAGTPRKLDPAEPYRILTTKAEARAFDLATWQFDQREQLRAQSRAKARAQALKDARESLRRDLALTPPTEDIEADIVAAGLARRLDSAPGQLILVAPAQVNLSGWPYVGCSGTALFTPAAAGHHLLTHGTPTRRDDYMSGAAVRSGRSPVIGHLELDGQTWTAYLGSLHKHGLSSRSVELVGPGVAGTWTEYEGQDVGEWVSACWEEATREADAVRLNEALAGLRGRLLTEYAVTPATQDEQAAGEVLKREGIAYEMEGTLVLR